MLVRVLSYGGGLDSFAMLLDSIERRELPDLCVFADVADREGRDPGEWPATYQHMRDHVLPLCAREGIEFLWLDTEGSPIRGQRSLFAYYQHLRKTPLTVSRMCTLIAKTERIERAVAQEFPGRDVEMWIGFEAGEEERIAKDPHAGGTVRKDGSRRTNRFPLAERGFCRCRCETYVRRLGFPVPPKSACVFCPFSSRRDFRRLRDVHLPIFMQVAGLEDGRTVSSTGKYLRYGYQRPPLAPDHSTDPKLPEWVDLPFRAERPKPCTVCGAAQRAVKTPGCAPAESV